MQNLKSMILLITLTLNIDAKDYTQKIAVKQFINQMAQKHRCDKSKLHELFKEVEFQQRALGIFNPKYQIRPKTPPKPTTPTPKHGAWDRYEKEHLGTTRVEKGVQYLYDYRTTFQQVHAQYGVPPEYIAAIIGIESYYGNNRGKFPVFDTLTTLAFEPNRRSDYFKYELEKFLLLSKNQAFNPKKVKGSYAGAIGLGQFMPSSYAYAVDFNKDGTRSMQTASDAIAGIANYFKKNGWRKWEPVATPVSYQGKRFSAHKTGYSYTYSRAFLKGIQPKDKSWSYNGKVRLIKLARYHHDELWYGTHNFYVITRYNHSAYYAMAVHQLAQQIKKGYKQKYGSYLR